MTAILDIHARQMPICLRLGDDFAQHVIAEIDVALRIFEIAFAHFDVEAKGRRIVGKVLPQQDEAPREELVELATRIADQLRGSTAHRFATVPWKMSPLAGAWSRGPTRTGSVDG